MSSGERFGPLPLDADHNAGVPAAEFHLQRVGVHQNRHHGGVQA
ncbi:jg24432, partial [Pararge aegeria aegeria]